MKNILIIGQNSYIGNSIEQYLQSIEENYIVNKVTAKDNKWKNINFSGYDVVIHLSAIVHKKEMPEMEQLYYDINTNLPVNIAKKAKEQNVKQFIFFSTMAVYGEEGRIGKEVIITKNTPLNPRTFYGKSKMMAEEKILILNDNMFKVAIVRPPMVYGKNCTGNYAKLEKLSKKSPVFPKLDNARSMIDIQKLCLDIKQLIDNAENGIFLPQDDEYVNTSILFKNIARENGKKVYLSRFLGVLIEIFGKEIGFINKIFGNLVYEK